MKKLFRIIGLFIMQSLFTVLFIGGALYVYAETNLGPNGEIPRYSDIFLRMIYGDEDDVHTMEEVVTMANESTNIFPLKGNVGIGTITPSSALDVSGNISADYPSSDRHIATKKYVDDHSGGSLGDCTGVLFGYKVSTCPAGYAAVQYTCWTSNHYCRYPGLKCCRVQ